jgi:hypothetical protein
MLYILKISAKVDRRLNDRIRLRQGQDDKVSPEVPTETHGCPKLSDVFVFFSQTPLGGLTSL